MKGLTVWEGGRHFDDEMKGVGWSRPDQTSLPGVKRGDARQTTQPSCVLFQLSVFRDQTSSTCCMIAHRSS